MPTTNKVSNRLINEKSPYLLQHAHNPVNWYSWSPEAFSKAKSEKKPIFLSIGYSTCHWCHVMERESFEDDDVAEVLNRSFVSIKVDREERPDIDEIYMNVCTAITGSGGWPLTIVMTPEQKPFFAGTYIPKNNRMGMQGLISLLENIEYQWKENQNELVEIGDKIVSSLNKDRKTTAKELSEEVLEEAFSQFKYNFDRTYGGFGSEPKFPTPHNLIFLMRYFYASKEKTSLDMALKTLDTMYRGGIYDHIGYGFSRYSVDKKWLVPHFEKMLYDNALLAYAYTEAFKITKNDNYKNIVDQIFTYILRDMTSNEGGFYCAEDADSEGVEGKFYVWSKKEINSVLGEDNGKRFSEYFNVTDTGNFEGENILNLIETSKIEFEDEFLNSCRKKLFDYREKRIHPYKDDKILTSWNGLIIAALAFGGRSLKNETYINAAEKAVTFIFTKLIDANGRLLSRYRHGEASIKGYLTDYSFLIWGLIELYEATYKSEYIEKAIKLNNDLIKYFWDDKNKGLFLYGSDSEELISRPKEIYDGAIPSGNSVSALNFIRLSRLTGSYDLEDKCTEILQSFSEEIESYPMGYSFSLLSVLFLGKKSKEITLVSNSYDNTSKEFLEVMNDKYNPLSTFIYYIKGDKTLENVSNFVSDYQPLNDKPTVYICENFSCNAPVTNISDLKKLL
ncbi:thioredoxin [Clostridium acetobutylicum]|nr:thioredoxin [Clostridium acetobutylicum]